MSIVEYAFTEKKTNGHLTKDHFNRPVVTLLLSEAILYV